MRTRIEVLGLCLTLLVATGCLKSVDVNESGKYTCESNGDCKTGYSCQSVAGKKLCIKDGTPLPDATVDATADVAADQVASDQQADVPAPVDTTEDVTSDQPTPSDVGDTVTDQTPPPDTQDQVTPPDVQDVGPDQTPPDSSDAGETIIVKCSSELHFADKLETAIREELGVPGAPYTGPITQASFSTKSVLNLAGRGIDDLGGIDCLPESVTTLILARNQLVTEPLLAPLSAMVWLKVLDLNGNNQLVDGRRVLLDNITPLQPLVNLEILNLNFTAVTDLGPLSQMTKLKRLYIGWLVGDQEPEWLKERSKWRTSYVVDLGVLGELVALEELDLYGQHVTKLDALKPNGGKPNLTVLNVGANRLTTLDLSCCRAITHLNVSQQPIQTVTGAIQLAVGDVLPLQALDISGTRVQTFEFLPLIANTVTELRMSGLNVTFAIADLQDLSKLQILDLSTSQVPSMSLENKPQLRELTLSGSGVSDLCGLFGTGPAPPLERVDLSNNSFGPTVTFDCLNGKTSLKRLDLRGNGLVTSQLITVQTLPNLEELYLDSNEVGDLKGIFGEVVKFTKLKRLALKGSKTLLTNVSQLTSTQFPALEWLDLRSNGIANIAPLGSLTTLKTLDLSFNYNTTDGEIKDITPLKFLINLEELRLEGSKPQGAGLDALQSLSKLRILSLRDTKCAEKLGGGPSTLLDSLSPSTHTELRWLDVSGCALTNLNQVVSFPALESLEISFNSAVDFSALDTSPMSNLQVLRMNFMSDVDVFRIAVAANEGRLPQLTALYLSGSAIVNVNAEPMPKFSIAHILKSALASRLTVLDLDSNLIDNVDGFGNLSVIRYLRLAANTGTPTSITNIDTLVDLASLQHLDVSKNAITQLPTTFNATMLPNLKFLYLKLNPFTTPDTSISAALQGMNGLIELDVAHLELTSIGFVASLTHLERLYVSTPNAGTGISILDPLMGLKFLKYVDLYYNKACTLQSQQSNREALQLYQVEVDCNF